MPPGLSREKKLRKPNQVLKKEPPAHAKAWQAGERCALSSRATTKPGRKGLGSHAENTVRVTPTLECVYIKLRESNETFLTEN